jgi:hypothetical protein
MLLQRLTILFIVLLASVQALYRHHHNRVRYQRQRAQTSRLPAEQGTDEPLVETKSQQQVDYNDYRHSFTKEDDINALRHTIEVLHKRHSAYRFDLLASELAVAEAEAQLAALQEAAGVTGRLQVRV